MAAATTTTTPALGAPREGAPPAATDAPKKKLSKRTKIIAVVALVVAAIGALAYWLHARHFEDTDDAQVDGDISAVSPKVAGNLKSVFVIENQHVNAGDPIAEIDPTDFEIAVQEARATVAQAEAQLRAEEPNVAITATTNNVALATTSSDVGSARADIAGAEALEKQTVAQLAQARANETLAATELTRAKTLIASGSISPAELDQRTAASDAAHASVVALVEAASAAAERVKQARARMSASSSRVVEVAENGPRQIVARRAGVAIRKANLDLAEAQLRQAEQNLAYTKIVAPVSGVVGKKSINIGDRVQPGQELVAITQVERLWITANFRETQLRLVRPGQPVRIHIDAIGGDLHGTVESVGGATGSRYSLLPPENATGNYVKVVQRVPVRIAFDRGQSGIDSLRPGLSVEPRVRVR